MDGKLWEKCVAFHGHECPGLAIGFRACEAAAEKLKLELSPDEEVACVTENDACGVDAVQVITGCTMGKGNLLYRGAGKMAFNFYNRKTGESLRVIARPSPGEMDREQRLKHILSAPAGELFAFGRPREGFPEKARMFATAVCELCGESAAEHKMRLQEGKKVCLDCFREYSRGW